ncbi:DUF7670 domain-containing protein [Nitrolancea hollandica]|uniref:DUF7670 domain-containing protein n=1 Tax=Nitrolancea hollandica Lb TaxID=1129897 RepID=I4EJ90_9BACT|nr:hypothetical protein [Nitrolancea hollandica]CCF84752.1 membrane hypothetical protein [Nitrolancea hollandica Lb]
MHIERNETSGAMRFKIVGLILLLIPVLILTFFAVGESIGGDLSGLGHLIQAAPLVILALLAWKRPRAGGLLLIGLGTLLALGFLLFTNNPEPIAILLVFGPPILSGLLFLMAARRQAQ